MNPTWGRVKLFLPSCFHSNQPIKSNGITLTFTPAHHLLTALLFINIPFFVLMRITLCPKVNDQNFSSKQISFQGTCYIFCFPFDLLPGSFQVVRAQKGSGIGKGSGVGKGSGIGKGLFHHFIPEIKTGI